jgi:hypothetical protein
MKPGQELDTTSGRAIFTKEITMNTTTEIDLVFHRAKQIAADGLTQYQREEQRRLEVYQKLKAERLAREAAAK